MQFIIFQAVELNTVVIEAGEEIDGDGRVGAVAYVEFQHQGLVHPVYRNDAFVGGAGFEGKFAECGITQFIINREEYGADHGGEWLHKHYFADICVSAGGGILGQQGITTQHADKKE